MPNIVKWALLHPRMTYDHLGLLVHWLNADDPRSAADQFDSHYPYGGFKQFPIGKFKRVPSAGLESHYDIQYPGDPVLRPLAMAKLRNETICFYPGEFVAVFQPDGSFICARFD